VLLFPRIPARLRDSARQAFDLADRLQTPVFVMLDLDIGMNEWLTALRWDDSRAKLDRGKVMTHEMLEAGKDFGRYKDVDGDGIPYRTYPGTHPTKGAFFTRGTSRDRYARYSEEGGPTMSTTWSACCASSRRRSQAGAGAGDRRPRGRPEARRDLLRLDQPGHGRGGLALLEKGVHVDALRVRAFPFSRRGVDFIAAHDASSSSSRTATRKLRTLLMTEADRSGEGSCRCCTTTARRSPRASSPAIADLVRTRSGKEKVAPA
jgi:2-oxoglutarate ferredoxin oxidoreductase subunit alpha